MTDGVPSWLAWWGRSIASVWRGASQGRPIGPGDRSPERAALARAIASIPFRRIETDGQAALAAWERLQAEDKGWPVVVGGDRDLVRLAEWLEIGDARSAEAILAAAEALRFPDALHALRAEERQHFEAMTGGGNGPGLPPRVNRLSLPDGQWQALSPEEIRGLWEDSARPKGAPAIGEWPDVPEAGPGLTVARDHQDHPLPKVHILVLPTRDGTAAPAFLKWGGWNANPPPELHVAALRSWRDRHGAELVGISNDVLNLRVTRRPETREAALALAREQSVYCEDIVLQGVGTLAPLAAILMASDWWYFWWD
ncbi:DUF4253 domain-containing protein [Plastoroseomonas hellenica]|uniref:DUF4253 domain-containing protein n=1 Tax=Plastoroseomonas hellenica TaxID=2687306 RepID=UPI001BA4BD3F|nr:DUF4253 domain-containing protein [Plastoroseomonas hellenica]MBR0646634.1 DUF4253 domain-containing protein [Plastoroseomonas hellenica]